jgi:SAM-dependent methyltransferase
VLEGNPLSSQNKYWNELYQHQGNEKPAYDLWLDKYAAILAESKSIPIIDLGCGFGNDTLYLHERGYSVISCDFSREALKRLEYFIDKPVTLLLDMKERLPFENQSAKIVIADLSLHYFSWQETLEIVAEIKRVLKKDGYLLARVNSVKDTNYGAAQGVVIEENYYDVDGKLKRFFNKVQLDELFRTWEVKYINEYEMGRYTNAKILWELAVENKD